MKIVQSHLDTGATQWEKDQIYNGLDCCVTLEVMNALQPQFTNTTGATYALSKALQAPVLEMRLRGVRIDAQRKSEVIDECYDKIEILERNLDRIVLEGVGLPGFNWRSNPDLHKLFYDRLRIPVIKKQGRPTVDRDAMERMEAYLIARPIVAHIMAMRDIAKKISFLRTEIDPDGRLRTSLNIAGTSTGRFSSSVSEFGTGTNTQNVEEILRSVLIADPGMKLAKFDAKSGESYCVGAIEWNLFQDGTYLDACESGDPHTATARICWPKLGWTGILEQDKGIAEQPYYRHYTYRFMCKKLGHGSNYGGKPATLSQQAKLPQSVVEDFQPKYFRAYPAHERWQRWVENTIRREGKLTSLTGRQRHFFGRRNDDSTLREAIAYDPQGSLADIVNNAMLGIWRSSVDGTIPVQLYMHDHDALTFQYPEYLEDELIPTLAKALEYPVELAGGRTLVIPYDCQTGWNRGKYDPKKNPDGLKDYRPGDKRQRTPEVDLLDRRA